MLNGAGNTVSAGTVTSRQGDVSAAGWSTSQIITLHGPAQLFGLAVSALLGQAPTGALSRGLGRATAFWPAQPASDQPGKSLEGMLAIAELAAVAVSYNVQNTLVVHPAG